MFGAGLITEDWWNLTFVSFLRQKQFYVQVCFRYQSTCVDNRLFATVTYIFLRFPEWHMIRSVRLTVRRIAEVLGTYASVCFPVNVSGRQTEGPSCKETWCNLHRGQLTPVPVNPQYVGVHAGDEGGLDDGPVLGVGVEVADVPAASRPHEPGRAQLPQQLRSHPDDHLHRRGRHEVLVAEWPLPAFRPRSLPSLQEEESMYKALRDVTCSVFSDKSHGPQCLAIPTWKTLRRHMWSLPVLAENFLFAIAAARFWDGAAGRMTEKKSQQVTLALVTLPPPLPLMDIDLIVFLLDGTIGIEEELTGISVCQWTSDGQNWVQTLQNHRIQDHFPVSRFNRQICQVMTQLSQLVKGVQGVNLLQKIRHSSAQVTVYFNNAEDRSCATKVFAAKSDTLSRWTAFLVMRKAGGSGALARKSSIRELTGANNFVCKHNSWKTIFCVGFCFTSSNCIESAQHVVFTLHVAIFDANVPVVGIWVSLGLGTVAYCQSELCWTDDNTRQADIYQLCKRK